MTRAAFAELLMISATDPRLWVAVMLLCGGFAAVAVALATYRIVRWTLGGAEGGPVLTPRSQRLGAGIGVAFVALPRGSPEGLRYTSRPCGGVFPHAVNYSARST